MTATALTDNSFVNFRIPNNIKQRFDHLAKVTARPMSFYLRTALENQIDQLEAIYISEKRFDDWRAGKTKALPLEEVMKEFNVEG